MIASFFAFDPGYMGGVSIAAGDLNGDGLAEIVVGAGREHAPEIRIFDGANLPASGIATPIGQFNAFAPTYPDGVRIALGDTNGDLVLDVIAAPGPNMEPRVNVFDGTTVTTAAPTMLLRSSLTRRT